MDFGGDVKVIEFKAYRREGVSDEINAYVFEPIVTEKRKVPPGFTLPKKKRKGIKGAMYAMFDEKGVDGVSYDECESAARKIKPDTKFDRSHFSWYKKEYLKKEGDGKTNSASISLQSAKKIPVGLKLRRVYKEIEFKAVTAEDNKIAFHGKLYSPSAAAAKAVRSTGHNESPSINGWDWWKFVDPETGTEKPIDVLRRR